MNLLKLLFGEYYLQAKTTLVTRKRGGSSSADPDILQLKGMRIVIMQEPESDDKINVGFIKSICGNDIQNARGF